MFIQTTNQSNIVNFFSSNKLSFLFFTGVFDWDLSLVKLDYMLGMLDLDLTLLLSRLRYYHLTLLFIHVTVNSIMS